MARVACQRLVSPKNLPRIETSRTRPTRPTRRSLGDSGIAKGKPRRELFGQRPGHHDVVDHGLGGGRRNQLQERRQREPHERQRERRSMADQDPVELAVQPSQRAMLDRAWARPGLPAAPSRRTGTGSDTLGIEVGWQSVDGMMTKELLGCSGRMHGHPEPGSQMILYWPTSDEMHFAAASTPSLQSSQDAKVLMISGMIRFMKSGIVVLFGLTSFLAAALLFSVQPMIGKMVLPVLGGTPAVWNTCLVYFQVMLLGGYLFAHGVITPKAPSCAGSVLFTLSLLAVLLALGYALQPIAIGPEVSEEFDRAATRRSSCSEFWSSRPLCPC